ncbi:unnamed protein product [Coffea canephora]|uniref:Uncharacterized protein n=1 Tax=Coffea canephora TaxID=49390 RepID=A0A068UT67_COFCA|nr:unnamed protein product [Coffea canephora]
MTFVIKSIIYTLIFLILSDIKIIMYSFAKTLSEISNFHFAGQQNFGSSHLSRQTISQSSLPKFSFPHKVFSAESLRNQTTFASLLKRRRLPENGYGRHCKEIIKLIGEPLITNEGKKWAKVHKLANHSFLAESLKSKVPEMIASVEGRGVAGKQRYQLSSYAKKAPLAPCPVPRLLPHK